MKLASPSFPSSSPILPILPVGIALALLAGIAVGHAGVLALAPVLGLLAVLAAWKTPGIVFALFLAIPFYKGSIDPLLPVDATATLALLCGVAATPAITNVIAGKADPHMRRAFLLWLLPVTVVIAGALYATNPDQGMRDTVDFVVLVWLASLAGIRVAQHRSTRMQFIATLAAVGLVTTAIGLLEFGELGQYERVTTLGANTINAARAAMLVPLIGLSFVSVSRITWPLVLLASAPAIMVAVATGSRGPVIMAAVAALVPLIVHGGGGGRVKRSALVAIAGIALVLMPLPGFITAQLPSFAVARFTLLGDSVRALVGEGDGNLGTSEQARLIAWSLSTDMFEARPLAGWGTAGFAGQAVRNGIEHIPYPHNLILQTMSDYGIVGLIAVGTVVVMAVRSALHRRTDPSMIAIATIFVFMLLNVMVSDGFVTARTFWGVLVLVLALPEEHNHQTALHVVDPDSLTYRDVDAPPSRRR